LDFGLNEAVSRQQSASACSHISQTCGREALLRADPLTASVNPKSKIDCCQANLCDRMTWLVDERTTVMLSAAKHPLFSIENKQKADPSLRSG
jgi:hypothetical protein